MMMDEQTPGFDQVTELYLHDLHLPNVI
jgi:hypothetical protein